MDWATQALKDITAGVNENGLAGGIDVLSQKIEELASNESVQKMLESIGTLVGTIFDGVIDKILPELVDAAPKLLSAFLGGLSDSTSGSSNDVSTLVGLLSGSLSDLFNSDNGIMGIFQKLFHIKPVANVEDIQTALDKAAEEGDLTVIVNGIEFSSSLDANTIMDEMLAAQNVGGVEIPGDIIPHLKADDIQAAIETALEEGVPMIDIGKASGLDVSWMLTPEDAQAVVGALHKAGEDGAKKAAEALSDTIGNSGTDTGKRFGNNFQAALNSRKFSIGVTANLNGQQIHKNATAMATGRIYDRPTLFGYADGAYQQAGDAGPEAVVGTHSLNDMITRSVRSTMAESAPRQADEKGLKEQTSQIISAIRDLGAMISQAEPEEDGALRSKVGNVNRAVAEVNATLADGIQAVAEMVMRIGKSMMIRELNARPRQQPVNVTLELNRAELAHTVFDLNQEESQRRGVNLER